MRKRKPAYPALFVIGLAMMSLAISVNMSFLGAGVVFMVLGAAGMAREKKAARKGNDKPGDV